MRGIDLSNNNGEVTFDGLKPACGFVMTKVTEGVGYEDPLARRNFGESARVQLPRGAYHFARPDLGNGAEAEADWFINRLAALGGVQTGDLLVLDIEVGRGDLSAWALAWLAHVQQVTGVRPLIYTGGWFGKDHLFDARLGTYVLWDSAYTFNAPLPWGPFRDGWAIWQFSDQQSWPGVPGGTADGNLFQGSPAQLMALGKPAPVPQGPATPIWPTAPEYIVTVDTHLRVRPNLFSDQDVLVTKGTRVVSTPAPHDMPSWTFSWRYVRDTVSNHQDYIIAKDLQAA